MDEDICKLCLNISIYTSYISKFYEGKGSSINRDMCTSDQKHSRSAPTSSEIQIPTTGKPFMHGKIMNLADLGIYRPSKQSSTTTKKMETGEREKLLQKIDSALQEKEEERKKRENSKNNKKIKSVVIGDTTYTTTIRSPKDIISSNGTTIKEKKGEETKQEEKQENNTLLNVNENATPASTNSSEDQFYWAPTDEPHATRRKLIIAKYPEIKKLFGPDSATKYKIAFIFVIQMLGMWVFSDASWPTLLFFTYTLSGSCNHFLTLAMHELAHNLGFKTVRANKWGSIITNLPMGIPAAISFKRYHMEHHRYQGEDWIDVDVPTELEGKIFQGKIMKAFFLILNPAFYSLRPLFTRPKQPQVWEAINISLQLSFDAFIFFFFGFKSLFYLVFGTLLGMGIHPMAGHFIAEHFVYNKGQETYSYYGPLNWLSLHVGYHNEHHDFPFIPGSRLHLVRKIAPEFYDDIPHYYSWSKCLYDFIMDGNITPFSRMKRKTLSEEDKKALTDRDR